MKLGPIYVLRDRTYDEMVNRIQNLKRQLDEVTKGDFRLTYQRLVTDLKKTMSEDEAMSRAVGGAFAEVGALELALLQQLGLADGQYVVDVGCGSGRLAKPLSLAFKGDYLGIDVVPDLVRYAERIVARPSWRFEVADGLRIPEADGRADFICFFSVFTHLRHEESYVYLRDAIRVARSGGRIVFSFLEFSVPTHWEILEYNLALMSSDRIEPLNQFMSRDLVEAWAKKLDVEIELIRRGDEAFIGAAGAQAFGQSVAVLKKRA
ncbi:MAG TPA: class I SAM-dependent methyltransferase [Polyangia bacterium]|jgi:ubiquinone/menaquinone biosynthesis C-methylase UbiE